MDGGSPAASGRRRQQSIIDSSRFVGMTPAVRACRYTARAHAPLLAKRTKVRQEAKNVMQLLHLTCKDASSHNFQGSLQMLRKRTQRNMLVEGCMMHERVGYMAGLRTVTQRVSRHRRTQGGGTAPTV